MPEGMGWAVPLRKLLLYEVCIEIDGERRRGRLRASRRDGGATMSQMPIAAIRTCPAMYVCLSSEQLIALQSAHIHT